MGFYFTEGVFKKISDEQSVGVMGKMTGHRDELARGDQFIGIGNRTSIDMDQGPGLKGIRFLVHIDLGIDAFHLLYEGILQ